MRKKFQKCMAVILAGTMLLSLAGCKKDDTVMNKGEVSNTSDTEKPNNQQTKPTEKRDLTIGTWWLQYYDSSNTALEDNPNYAGTLADEMKFENVKKIEEKYNCTFRWENLTYDGTKESINNSILAGSPDCDIYLVDLTFGIPAALNGLATDLKNVLPADDDLFTDQMNINYLDLGDNKVCLLKRVEAQGLVENTYPLAFNLQMLQDNNLEDPRDLYARNEWTWDKFVEYLKVLTKDTNGDGAVDQYGYCGYQQETFEQLLLSNGGEVASGKTQKLDDVKTVETLQFIQDLYLTYKVCYPYDTVDPSNTMRFEYRNGNVGFWPGAAWIAGQNADYDWNDATGTTLEFDTCYVQWPIGYSGNKDTNKAKISGGEYYIIPAGVKDPQMVYNVLYDMWNWYDGDTSVRDDEETLLWWYSVTAKNPDVQKQNFEVMSDIGSREQFDLWNNLGISYDFTSLFNGTYTPAQFVETYKQQVQDALDAYFK